jgi:alkylhydroperoxidase/carboxymuconolactone decarboxylase family protein YurZ
VGLTPKDRRLIRVISAIVCGHWEELVRLRREAPEGEPDRTWRETVIMSHLFAGFPRAVEALEVLDSAGGLGTPDPDELERCTQNGQTLFDRIYEGRADSVRGRLQSFHAEFASWIAEHAYGRVMSRPGIDADRRELLAVVALALTGSVDRQLRSHLRGALRCGATREEIGAAFDTIADLISTDRRAALAQLLDRSVVERGRRDR